MFHHHFAFRVEGSHFCKRLITELFPLMQIFYANLQFDSTDDVYFVSVHARGCLRPINLLFLPSPLCKHPFSSFACTPAVICAARGSATVTLMSTASASSRACAYVCTFLWSCVHALHSEFAWACHTPFDSALTLMNADATGLNAMLLAILPIFCVLSPFVKNTNKHQTEIFPTSPAVLFSDGGRDGAG